ncbi:hypothetical protein CNR22_14375 [Sphingobacteriaceae bacterium]|nr:hypothetical protein CNR22_14375 [Sphingobacteriaceae bacterium]
MLPPFSPLQKQSHQILEFLQRSASQKNPAWFLYHHKVRSPLFMAESVTRILTEITEEKFLLKAGKKIKKLEDSLGALEDYDTLVTLFSKNKKIKKEQVAYFEKKLEKTQKKLNSKLIEKEFYQEIFQHLSSSKLNLNNKEWVEKFKKQISKELNDGYSFFTKLKTGFTSMEEEVHEIRRNLRWISIYAQSLDGLIVLDADSKKYSWEKKFITQAEKKSPYNKLPLQKNLEAYIHFNKKAFLALSFVITKLGEIKDKGLRWENLAESLPENKNAMDLAAKQLNLKYNQEDLFKEAYDLLEDYFVTHRIHELLLKK